MDDAYGTWPNLYERTRTNQFWVRLPRNPSFSTLFHLLNSVLCLYNGRKFPPESFTYCWTPRGKRPYKNDGLAHVKMRFGTSSRAWCQRLHSECFCSTFQGIELKKKIDLRCIMHKVRIRANKYMKYQIFELQRKRSWSSQLCTQLTQLWN